MFAEIQSSKINLKLRVSLKVLQLTSGFLREKIYFINND